MSQPKSNTHKKREQDFRERRRDPREPCLAPLRFFEITGEPPRRKQIGKSKDVSHSGMKITCMAALHPGQVVALQLDPALLTREFPKEKLIFVAKDKVLAEVVWRKLKLDTGLFEVGLKFVPAARQKELAEVVKEAELL